MANHNRATIESNGGISNRTVFRIVLIVVLVIIAALALAWVLYKLTTVILLVVLAIFFAYLVAPLVDLVQRPVRLGGRERMMPRALAIGIVYVVLFAGIGLAIYLLAPQLAAQFPEFKQQASAYFKTITSTTDRLNQYFKQHRMPEGVVKAVNDTFLQHCQRCLRANARLNHLSSLAGADPDSEFFLLKGCRRVSPFSAGDAAARTNSLAR